MPRSRRYSITGLPGTLQRSCREAQEAFLSALDDAVRTHGAGDQAHRIAYMALKQKFEKRDDHWIAKDNPADRGGGGGGTADQRAARGTSSGQQIQRPAS
jgi:cation transport regulator ChaB